MALTWCTLLCTLVAVRSGARVYAREAGAAIGNGLLFYAPLDEHARGLLAPYRVGLESPCAFHRAAGRVGGAAVAPESTGLPFPLQPFLSREQGAVAMWFRVPFDPRNPTEVRSLIELGKFGKVYQWKGQHYLTFALYYHHIDEHHDYSCHASMDDWRRGEWKHLVVTWSWPRRRRRIYVDGGLADERPITRVPNVITDFRVGRQAGVVDELCVYSREIDAREVARLFAAGTAGRPAVAVSSIPPARGAVERLPQRPPAGEPPSFVNWSFEGAEGRSNAVRGEVTLHGWWRWQVGRSPYQPPDPEAWFYRKVPNESHYGESFPVRDRKFRVVPHTTLRPGAANLNGVPQWCEREFVLPAAWRGRRIVLAIDSLMKGGAVFLNGRLLSALPEENLGADYDITDQCVRDGKPNRLTIFSHGIDGEMRVLSTPLRTAVEDVWLRTSWRKKSLTAQLEIRSAQAVPLRIEVQVLDKSGQTVMTRFGTSREVRAGRTRVDFSAPWSEGVQPWSLRRPRLYSYVVILRDPSGRVLDRTFPERFGFREFWIEGGDFMLNGRPVHFIGHSNSHLTGASEIGDSAYMRYSLQRWRAAGLNCVTPWQSFGRMPTLHPLLDIADEMGMAILPVVWLPTGERGGETPELRARWERLYERYVRRYRRHPSLLVWLVGSGSHNYDFCPSVLDGRFDAGMLPKAKPLRRTWAFFRRIDPTRPAFGLSSGNIGAAWTSMAYQGFDVDLQERENWPIRWAQTRHKPLMPCEFSLPCHPDWFTRSDKRSGGAQYHPKHSKSIATEYGAMLLGPGVYAKEPEPYLASLATRGVPPKSQAYWDVKLLFADTLRAWRAYGVSFVYHAEVPNFFTGNRPEFPSTRNLDPRRRQATPESLHGSLQAADDLSEFGKRVRAATEPLMAFIGGADGNFTRKDHAYWSGETVHKALVVVNDTEEPVTLHGSWRLTDVQGRVARQGTLQIACPPGRQETRRGVMEFTAPAVSERTDFRLSVSVPGVEIPPFSITVFPKRPAPEFPATGGIVLFDPVGDTRAMLARLGLRPADMPEKLSARHRLIIGRHALENPEAVKRLVDAGFDQAVAAGMRALIFEQAAKEWNGRLLGLRMKRLDTRRAFVRCPGHPVLQGLGEADFKYLQGDSDLIPPYPDFPPTPPPVYPTHWWHWGNDHIVATYTLEKPQVGAVRAILDCGFDLVESPLLEAARGEGLLLFCQVDVTNRVGSDPVSTRLVVNLIRYLAAPAFRPPPGLTLDDLHRAVRAVATFEGYFARVPGGLPGVHDGEMFFREKLKLPAFAGKEQPALLKRVRRDGRTYWTTSLRTSDLRTEWQRAKFARIEAALRFLHGERTDDGPRLKKPGNLYPHDWNYVPEMKVDFDPYVYWRW